MSIRIKGVSDILHKLQQFTTIPLTKMKLSEDGISFFYDDQQNVAGEVHEEKDRITQIVFYSETIDERADNLQLDSALYEDAYQANEEVPVERICGLAYEIIATFDDRPLVLDALVDFETHFLAIFEATDDRYGIVLPNSGAHIEVKKDGTLQSASFFHENYTVNYPEKVISKDKAAEILRNENLIVRGIETAKRPWRYNYVPDYNIYGISADGHVKYIADFPELQNSGYDELPPVDLAESLHALLVGDDEQAKVESFEDEDTRSWAIVQDEDFEYPQAPIVHSYTKEQLYERALKALKLVVGAAYGNYKVERMSDLTALLESAPYNVSLVDEDRDITFRFVYDIQDIQLQEYAVEIIMDYTFASILSMTVPKISAEALKKLTPPIITLEEANAIACKLVNVELSFERAGLVDNVYTLVYMLDYPESPTGGNIESINGTTGEVTYVETGFTNF